MKTPSKKTVTKSQDFLNCFGSWRKAETLAEATQLVAAMETRLTEATSPQSIILLQRLVRVARAHRAQFIG